MDKQQARDIVKDTLGKSFDEGQFAFFVRNLLNFFDETEKARFVDQGDRIPDAYKQYISSLERIGKYSAGDHKIDILIVRLKKETSIEHARTMQRNFIARYLSNGNVLQDAALVAFVSPDSEDWRFSLVTMDYRFEEGKNGKVKVKEEFTPARRWSFLVGANENSHTAQARLLPLMTDDNHLPTLGELEEAFNIEKVTKEFFEKYRDLFLRTKEELDRIAAENDKIQAEFAAKGVNTADFAKKLLGQIVFLYFLQKKGWFGVARDKTWGTGSKRFLRELFEQKHGRYENFFNDILESLFYEALRIDRSHEDHYYSRFNCKIPFLNGGLFDPPNNYDWVHTDILIASDLFSNQQKTREGDTGDGILDVFDRYNFTVKEDEPLEKEVAIDPEMLGKVFENLLETKDRKSSGTYYTPREIVHYMCRQCLINYLATGFSTDHSGENKNPSQTVITGKAKQFQLPTKEDIETFIHSGEQITVNEVYAQKEGRETRINPCQLPESIRRNARKIDEKLFSIRICDPAIGSGAFPVGMMNEIVRARNVLSTFIKDSERSPYHFKWQCIEKSLYGVDIDPGAVEIARLRLWLSLVVDENDIKQIQPLPNLDYKIVCGNSLLGLPHNMLPDAAISTELEKKKNQYFSTTIPSEKNKIRALIYNLFLQMMDHYKKYDPQMANVTFDFHAHFSEVFHENDGFDIVIANPPYVRHEMIKELKPDLAKAFGGFYCGTADLYTYFYKRGVDLLKSGAHLCYIAPNKFMRASYGKNTRKLLTKEVTPLQVIDFGDLPVFNATTYPSVVLVEKRTPGSKDLVNIATFTDKTQIEKPEHALRETGFMLSLAELKAEGWTLEKPEMLALMDKLRKAGKPLGEYVQGRFYYGIKTGLNKAFVIDETTRKKLIAEDPKSAEKEKGKEVEKEKHGRKPGTYKWYEIQDNIAYYEEFDCPKITWGNLAIEPKLAFDDSGSYISAPANIIPTNDLCFLAILNSPISKWWISFRAATRSGGFLEYKPMYVGEIPIPTAIAAQQSPIIDRVQKILAVPDSPDVHKLEAEINRLVYKLYDLTDEEIKIVEGEKKLATTDKLPAWPGDSRHLTILEK